MTPAAMEARGVDASTSVGKALMLFGLFSPARPEMGVSEMARQSGLSKATAFRLLNLLVEGGLLVRRGTMYGVSPRLAEVACSQAPDPNHVLHEAAIPFLQDLYELTHETVHLAVLAGAEIIYVEKLFGHRASRSPSRIGTRFPATCTALGKAMLAFSNRHVVEAAIGRPERVTPYSLAVPSLLITNLRKVRTDGVAFDYEESKVGLTCIASPILNRRGEAVAAISISGPVDRFRADRHGTVVKRAAAGASMALQATA